MMKSGDMPALLRRTQAHTCREWAEYRDSSSLGVLGWIGLAASLKRALTCLSVRYIRFFFYIFVMLPVVCQAGQEVALRVPFTVLHKWDKVRGDYQRKTE